MPPAIARRLVYFFTMGQVWYFLDVAMEKPPWAMEACVVVVKELKPVKQADSDYLRIRYEKLRAIGERAKMEGVHAHLLTEAVANKILNGRPPQGERVGAAKDGQVRSQVCGQLLSRHPAATGEAMGLCVAMATAPATESVSGGAPCCEGSQEVPCGGLQGSLPPAGGVQEVPEHKPHQLVHSLPHVSVV